MDSTALNLILGLGKQPIPAELPMPVLPPAPPPEYDLNAQWAPSRHMESIEGPGLDAFAHKAAMAPQGVGDLTSWPRSQNVEDARWPEWMVPAKMAVTQMFNHPGYIQPQTGNERVESAFGELPPKYGPSPIAVGAGYNDIDNILSGLQMAREVMLQQHRMPMPSPGTPLPRPRPKTRTANE